MTSKWIKELQTIFEGDEAYFWEDFLPTLNRIDKLLRKAKYHVDNESLYDAIEKETVSNEKVVEELKQEAEDYRKWSDIIRKSQTGRTATGVSSVVPVTDEEAEKIIDEFHRQNRESQEED